MLLQHRDLILTDRLDLDDMTIFFLALENKFDASLLIDAEMYLHDFKSKANESQLKVVFN